MSVGWPLDSEVSSPSRCLWLAFNFLSGLVSVQHSKHLFRIFLQPAWWAERTPWCGLDFAKVVHCLKHAGGCSSPWTMVICLSSSGHHPRHRLVTHSRARMLGLARELTLELGNVIRPSSQIVIFLNSVSHSATCVLGTVLCSSGPWSFHSSSIAGAPGLRQLVGEPSGMKRIQIFAGEDRMVVWMFVLKWGTGRIKIETDCRGWRWYFSDETRVRMQLSVDLCLEDSHKQVIYGWLGHGNSCGWGICIFFT